VGTVGAELEQSFGVLRQARRASDDPPAKVRGIGEPVRGNPALARRVGLAGSEGYVVPGDRAICLQGPVSGVCNTIEDALAGRAVAVDLCADDVPAGEVRLLGLAPDGVESVKINLDGGSFVSAPVNDNSYAAVTGGRPTSIEWSNGTTDAVNPLPIPADFAADCTHK
jgi:hypothetical protein